MSKTAPNNSLDKLQLGVTLAFKKGIAKKCGVNAAIVFNHILYWLDYNSPNPASHREGKIWMYETQEAMAEFFGFLSEKEVRNAIKILVDEGLLLKAHFHDDGWTKTNWYTVYDQELIDKSPVKKVSSKRPQGLIDTAPPGSSILPAGAHDHIREDKQEEKHTNTSAEARSLALYLFQRLKNRSPGFKEPNIDRWAKEMDKLLQLDHREEGEIIQLIDFSEKHKFYKQAILSPSAIRKHYDAMVIAKDAMSEQDQINANRQEALKAKEQHPEKLKMLSFNDKYAINASIGKEVPFNLPTESFRRAFAGLFGGRYDG